MALLHYANLGVRDPALTLRSVFHGLRDFSEYLSRTIDYLNSESLELRLAWNPASAPEGFEDSPGGFWIELTEVADRPNEPDRTFDSFLDEDVTDVHEWESAGDPSPGSRRRITIRSENKIRVLDRDPDTNRLLLARRPRLAELLLQPNTYTLERQLKAVRQLQDSPSPAHLPLLRLFESARYARWPVPSPPLSAPQWKVLIDGARPGTLEQRAFVDLALRTPDFALLEGPPGSGKTTAICELVLQLVTQGKRVLLCASTHVAVDNVLERLGPFSQRDGSDLVPVRVGDLRKVSELARPYQLERLVETERGRLLRFLQSRNPRTEAQEYLLRTVSRPATADAPDAIERMVLDAANLICGTTTGILRHPDLRGSASSRAGVFDALILDEASKTTFQEFLVPALLAKRWIIVGDPRQLSPFVEEAAVAANLVAAMPVEAVRNACVDVFLGGAGGGNQRSRRAAAVAAERSEVFDAYVAQAAVHGVAVRRPGDTDAGLADIVVGPAEELAKACDQLPADVGTVRGIADDRLERRARAYRHGIGAGEEEAPCWEDEMAWRLIRHFELRQASGSQTAAKLAGGVASLMPVEGASVPKGTAERVDRVRRVAFPSVLESLQSGFERRDGQKDGTALSDGLPPDTFKARHVLLEYQHRMHPDISTLSRERVYSGTALKDPPDMARRREWSYSTRRAVWLQVAGRFESGRNRNLPEVEAVIREMDRFRRWARENPKLDAAAGRAEPWEMALLTIYRGQERALRDRLRKYARAPNAYRHFDLRSGGRVEVRVEICTVDRFQGHEADFVILSIANDRSTNFLESVNRMNVALTRARYQRVVVGNRLRLRTGRNSLLQVLASSEPWETQTGGKE